MSASHQKKLRKSQSAEVQQQMTERQQTEAKQQKRVKRMTIAFFVCLALVAVFVIGSLVWNSGLIHRSATAVSVGKYDFSAAQVNYCYVDTVNSSMNDTSSFIPYLVSAGTPLDKQDCVLSEGKTWADYFLDSSVSALKEISALCISADAEGYALTEDDQANIDATISTLQSYATLSGYSSADQYLRMYYGNGSNLDSYREYITMQQLASSYQTSKLTGVRDGITDTEIETYIGEHTTDLTTYSYRTFTISATVLGDLEKATAAKDDMMAVTTEADYVKKTQEYCSEDYKDNYAEEGYTLKSTMGSSLSEGETKTWLTDSARKAGDMEFFEVKSTTDGEETVTGYTVLYFVGAEDNSFPLANVRHILIQPENPITDSDGNTTYSDADWEAAEEKANELLEDWKAGKATELSFEALVEENTDDTASAENGGLYEDVYPGQMVAEFEDWCFDEERKAGDTGIVKTTYGYHIMYYVGDSETTYAQYTAKNAIYSEKANAWYTELVDAQTVNTSGFGMLLVNKGLTLSSSN